MPIVNKKSIVEIDKIFGRTIKFSRVGMGLSLKDAVQKLSNQYQVKISSSYLSLIENGDRYMINEELFNSLKDFFQVEAKKALFKENELFSVGETKNARQVPVVYSAHCEKQFGSELLLLPGLSRIDLLVYVEDNCWKDYGLLQDDRLLCVKVSDNPNIDELVVFKEDNKLQMGYMCQQNGILGIKSMKKDKFFSLGKLLAENILGVCKAVIKKHLSLSNHEEKETRILQNIDEKKLYAEIARRKQVDEKKLHTAMQVVENILLDV